MSDTPDNDMVICPNCVHQFRAIPVNVQKQLSLLHHFEKAEGMAYQALRRELAEARNAALEEAAKVCEWYASWSKGPNKIDIELHKCAEAIRRLKR